MSPPLEQSRRRSIWVAAVRVMRVPFLPVSILPFIGGMLLGSSLRVDSFLWGLVAVATAALAANTANEGSDLEVDARDPRSYGFFGGSKALVEGAIAPAVVRLLTLTLCLLSAAAITSLMIQLQILWLWPVFLGAMTLALGYSLPPLRLCGRGLGELAVFLLFGPAILVGSACLNGQAWSAPGPWLISLPFGFLATAILVANEIPDAQDDAAGGKRTLVVRLGAQHGYLLLLALLVLACTSLLLAVPAAGLGWPAGLGLLGAPLAWRAVGILRRSYADKQSCLTSSRLIIAVHLLTGTGIIAGIILAG